MVAAMNHHTFEDEEKSVVQLLIDHKANVNYGIGKGEGPSQYNEGHPRTTALFLAQKANGARKEQGYPDDLRTMKELLLAGAKVHRSRFRKREL